MSSSSDSDDNYLVPPEIIMKDAQGVIDLPNVLPEKSIIKYNKAYEHFMRWRQEKKESSFSESVLMAYFTEKAKKYKPSSLWAMYSMLKSTLLTRKNVSIKEYAQLSAFLKKTANGFRSKKSKVLTANDIDFFLENAPDHTYLGLKVVLILGVNGACRCTELTKMTIDDIQIHGNMMLVKIQDTKTKIKRSFVISDNFYNIVKKYKDLRPDEVNTRRFLLQYMNSKCLKQVMGKNKISTIPREIAYFLNLPDPHEYTGHCFRRTSATLLADSGANLSTIKRQSGWKSTTMAGGYLRNSIGNKKRISKQITEPISCQPASRSSPQLSTSTEPMEMETYSNFNMAQTNVVFSAHGLMPPVFTPLNDDLTINYGIIPAYAQFLASNGIKSVLVGGTTGEHMSLSVADRKKVVDAWVEVAKTTGLHIQVQVGGAPLADVVNMATYCASVGADSLLTLPELYFKPASVSELVSYVELVAKAAPSLPVLYYHIPSMSRVEINMPAFVAKATARIPNFKGIKFTSNDLSEGAQVLRTLKDGQEMFLGADTLLAPAALLGIRSSIGTSFNLFPQLAQEILDAVENNDVARARVLQEKLSLAIEAHTGEGPWVPIMKAGMEIVTGIKVGPPSLPQRAISTEARNRIEAKLRALGLCK